ncbi:MAG: Ycf66 family protein [Cyanobacteria bacterium J06642_3]
MVNFGLNAAAILGLFLAVAGAGLFFLRSIRPELARDYDIFFAAVGLLCGIILLFNGWRLDPILQFGQFLLTGTAIFFAFESIRMRGAATEQARRNTTTVDRDRPVSRTRVYTEAELDQIDPYDNVYEGAKPNYNSPRLRGYDDPQPRSSRRPSTRRRPSSTTTDVREEPRRRPSRSRPESDYSPRVTQDPQSDRYGYPERENRPPRRRPTSPATNSYDEWDDTPRTSSRPRPRPPVEERYSKSATPSEPRRRPNAVDLGRSYEPEDDYGANDLGTDYDLDSRRNYDEQNESIPGDYVVDYQPLDNSEPDYSDDDYDNYEDSEQDGYGDYDDDPSDDNYDSYNEPPQRGKPLNLNKDYD